jgi:prepilin peptidase CpaA
MAIMKVVVSITLLFAVYSDIKYKKIPNKLTIPISIFGMIFWTIYSKLDGLQFSLGGLIVGLLVFIIPFALGGMGAGDVKLMAAVGSLMGWKLTVYSALLTAIAGGIIVIGYTIYKGYFIKMIRNFGTVLHKKILYYAYLITHNEKIMMRFRALRDEKPNFEKTYIPYGVAIAIGTLTVLIGNHFNYSPFI